MDANHTVSCGRSPLGALLNEIVVMIYGFLPDFDDAVNLSQTCKTLQRLYTASKVAITKEIMVDTILMLAATYQTYIIIGQVRNLQV